MRPSNQCDNHTESSRLCTEHHAFAGMENSMKKKTEKLAQKYRIEDGKDFRLKDFDPADTGGLATRRSTRPKSCKRELSARRNCRTCSMPRTSGRCC